MTSRALLFALAAAALTGPALAGPQDPPAQRATGVVRADAVAILADVVVRDRRGQPVTDLTAADFELYEDGVRQQIGSVTFFSSDDGALAATPPPGPPPSVGASGAAAPPVAAAPQPVIALVFDRLSPEARALAHKAALEYVTRAGGRAKIGVFGIDLSLTVYQGYTEDPALLQAAIEKVGRRSTSQFDSGAGRAGAEARSASSAASMTAFESAASAGGPAAAGAAATAPGAAPTAQFAEMERRAMETFDMLERDQQGYATSNSLLAMVNSMRGLPGRKSLILFSEGLAIPPAVVAQFRSVVDTANRANVSIYAMDAMGLRAESTSKEARDNINAAAARTLGRNPTADVTGAAMTQALERNEEMLRRDPHSGLGELAQDTGGLLISNTNDLAAGFRRVDEDMRNYYVLSYVPSNDTFDGKFRSIRVEVKRGGLSVASRKGYFAVRSTGAQPIRAFEAPALAMLDLTPVRNQFPVRAAAFRFPEEARPGLVPVLVSVPASSLTFAAAEAGQLRGDFTVLVQFRNVAGDVVRKLSQHYQFDGTPEQVEQVKKGDVLFFRQIELPAGVYSMETVVYDALADRASVRFSTFEQPAASTGALRVSSLILVARSERVSIEDKPIGNPLVVGDYLLYPNLGDPVSKAATRELGFFFTAYVPGTIRPTATLELARNGESLARLPISLNAPDDHGRVQQVGRLPIGGLEPGTYDLRVVLSDGKSPQARSVLVRVVE